MGAEVVDRVIPLAIVKNGHDPPCHLTDFAASNGNLTNAGNRVKGGVGHGCLSEGGRCGVAGALACDQPPEDGSLAIMAGTLPRLLAIDIDGTLTTPQHDISDRTAAAVGEAIAAGIQVVLATGRRYRDSLWVAERLGVTLPLVTTAGALIKDPTHHATQFRAAFADGVLGGVLRLIDAAGHEAVVYTDSFSDGFDFHCRGFDIGSEGLRSYLDRNRSLARLTPTLHEQPPADSFAAFCMGPKDAMLELEEAISAAFAKTTSVHVIRSPRYRGYLCEIAPAGVTKWSGIQQLAGACGISAADIWAVGDDVNDLPMIRNAGLGVAMGNADQRVQDAADRVTAANDADGLAILIEELLGTR